MSAVRVVDYLNTVTINQTRNFIGGKALHPRRCRRAHRGDGVSDGPARFTRGRHTTHVHRMRLLSRPPTSDPHPPPRHRRSQRPAQFARAAVTSCDYYRGLLLRCCAPPSSSTCSPSSYTPLLLGSAFVQYVDRTCVGASRPVMLPLGPESFGVLIGPSSSVFNIG